MKWTNGEISKWRGSLSPKSDPHIGGKKKKKELFFNPTLKFKAFEGAHFFNNFLTSYKLRHKKLCM